MTASVLIIGPGDMARRLALGLAASGAVARLVLAGRSRQRAEALAGLVASCHPCPVRHREIDGTDQSAVEALLRRERPDLVLQAASLVGPFSLVGRRDPVAAALLGAGFGAQICAQLPVITSVMRAAREIDHRGPIVNLSFPDATNAVLACEGLEPTVGVGNVAMIALRVRAALREERDADPPLVRMLAQHGQVAPAMMARMPEDPEERARVHLGEPGDRADDLAYRGYTMAPGIDYNEVTAASALPVLLALLPGAAPLRISTPGPHGLPGGWPVCIEEGTVELDLPPGVDRAEALDWQRRMARFDGVAGISDDGTVSLTESARAALEAVEPELARPLHPAEALARFAVLRETMVRLG